MRMSATEHLTDAVTPEEALWFAQQLRACGVDLLDISAGNIVPGHPAAVYPGYQLKYAEYLKRQVGILTAATDSIASGDFLEEALGAQRIDLAFVGRALLRKPFWVRRCAPGWRRLAAPNSHLRSRYRPL